MTMTTTNLPRLLRQIIVITTAAKMSKWLILKRTWAEIRQDINGLRFFAAKRREGIEAGKTRDGSSTGTTFRRQGCATPASIQQGASPGLASKDV